MLETTFHVCLDTIIIKCIGQVYTHLCYFVVPWLNAMLTALSTSSVYIETLNNDDWELPTGKWYVERDSRRICTFANDAPLKGCTDRNARSDNYYWIGNGEMSRGDRIRTPSQNRKRGFSLNFIQMYVRFD